MEPMANMHAGVVAKPELNRIQPGSLNPEPSAMAYHTQQKVSYPTQYGHPPQMQPNSQGHYQTPHGVQYQGGMEQQNRIVVRTQPPYHAGMSHGAHMNQPYHRKYQGEHMYDSCAGAPQSYNTMQQPYHQTLQPNIHNIQGAGIVQTVNPTTGKLQQGQFVLNAIQMQGNPSGNFTNLHNVQMVGQTSGQDGGSYQFNVAANVNVINQPVDNLSHNMPQSQMHALPEQQCGFQKPYSGSMDVNLNDQLKTPSSSGPLTDPTRHDSYTLAMVTDGPPAHYDQQAPVAPPAPRPCTMIMRGGPRAVTPAPPAVRPSSAVTLNVVTTSTHAQSAAGSVAAVQTTHAHAAPVSSLPRSSQPAAVPEPIINSQQQGADGQMDIQTAIAILKQAGLGHLINQSSEAIAKVLAQSSAETGPTAAVTPASGKQSDQVAMTTVSASRSSGSVTSVTQSYSSVTVSSFAESPMLSLNSLRAQADMTSQCKTSTSSAVAGGPSNVTPFLHDQKRLQHNRLSVKVPFGWKRTLEGQQIVYYSPSMVRLMSRQAILQYITSDDTCKCGLQCPLIIDRMFNFDTLVTSRPWAAEDMKEESTKLCNHRRKVEAMAALRNPSALQHPLAAPAGAAPEAGPPKTSYPPGGSDSPDDPKKAAKKKRARPKSAGGSDVTEAGPLSGGAASKDRLPGKHQSPKSKVKDGRVDSENPEVQLKVETILAQAQQAKREQEKQEVAKAKVTSSKDNKFKVKHDEKKRKLDDDSADKRPPEVESAISADGVTPPSLPDDSSTHVPTELPTSVSVTSQQQDPVVASSAPAPSQTATTGYWPSAASMTPPFSGHAPQPGVHSAQPRPAGVPPHLPVQTACRPPGPRYMSPACQGYSRPPLTSPDHHPGHVTSLPDGCVRHEGPPHMAAVSPGHVMAPPRMPAGPHIAPPGGVSPHGPHMTSPPGHMIPGGAVSPHGQRMTSPLSHMPHKGMMSPHGQPMTSPGHMMSPHPSPIMSPEGQHVMPPDHRTMSQDPRMTSQDPRMMMSQDPRMMSQDPQMMSQDPRMMLQDPRMMSQDPGMMSQDPRMMSQDPRMMSQDPRMMSQDPRMMSPNSMYMARGPGPGRYGPRGMQRFMMPGPPRVPCRGPMPPYVYGGPRPYPVMPGAHPGQRFGMPPRPAGYDVIESDVTMKNRRRRRKKDEIACPNVDARELQDCNVEVQPQTFPASSDPALSAPAVTSSRSPVSTSVATSTTVSAVMTSSSPVTLDTVTSASVTRPASVPCTAVESSGEALAERPKSIDPESVRHIKTEVSADACSAMESAAVKQEDQASLDCVQHQPQQQQQLQSQQVPPHVAQPHGAPRPHPQDSHMMPDCPYPGPLSMQAPYRFHGRFRGPYSSRMPPGGHYGDYQQRGPRPGCPEGMPPHLQHPMGPRPREGFMASHMLHAAAARGGHVRMGMPGPRMGMPGLQRVPRPMGSPDFSEQIPDINSDFGYSVRYRYPPDCDEQFPPNPAMCGPRMRMPMRGPCGEMLRPGPPPEVMARMFRPHGPGAPPGVDQSPIQMVQNMVSGLEQGPLEHARREAELQRRLSLSSAASSDDVTRPSSVHDDNMHLLEHPQHPPPPLFAAQLGHVRPRMDLGVRPGFPRMPARPAGPRSALLAALQSGPTHDAPTLEMLVKRPSSARSSASERSVASSCGRPPQDEVKVAEDGEVKVSQAAEVKSTGDNTSEDSLLDNKAVDNVEVTSERDVKAVAIAAHAANVKEEIAEVQTEVMQDSLPENNAEQAEPGVVETDEETKPPEHSMKTKDIIASNPSAIKIDPQAARNLAQAAKDYLSSVPERKAKKQASPGTDKSGPSDITKTEETEDASVERSGLKRKRTPSGAGKKRGSKRSSQATIASMIQAQSSGPSQLVLLPNHNVPMQLLPMEQQSPQTLQEIMHQNQLMEAAMKEEGPAAPLDTERNAIVAPGQSGESLVNSMLNQSALAHQNLLSSLPQSTIQLLTQMQVTNPEFADQMMMSLLQQQQQQQFIQAAKEKTSPRAKPKRTSRKQEPTKSTEGQETGKHKMKHLDEIFDSVVNAQDSVAKDEDIVPVSETTSAVQDQEDTILVPEQSLRINTSLSPRVQEKFVSPRSMATRVSPRSCHGSPRSSHESPRSRRVSPRKWDHTSEKSAVFNEANVPNNIPNPRNLTEAVTAVMNTYSEDSQSNSESADDVTTSTGQGDAHTETNITSEESRTPAVEGVQTGEVAEAAAEESSSSAACDVIPDITLPSRVESETPGQGLDDSAYVTNSNESCSSDTAHALDLSKATEETALDLSTSKASGGEALNLSLRHTEDDADYSQDESEPRDYSKPRAEPRDYTQPATEHRHDFAHVTPPYGHHGYHPHGDLTQTRGDPRDLTPRDMHHQPVGGGYRPDNYAGDPYQYNDDDDYDDDVYYDANGYCDYPEDASYQGYDDYYCYASAYEGDSQDQAAAGEDAPAEPTPPGDDVTPPPVTESEQARPTTLERIQRGLKRRIGDLQVEGFPDLEVSDDDSVDEEPPKNSAPRDFSLGELVWGATRGYPSWPGMLVSHAEVKGQAAAAVENGKVWVRWFGGDHACSQVEPSELKTMTEGLEAHHRACKKQRKGRRMNSSLEAAIQEAMDELDRRPDMTS